MSTSPSGQTHDSRTWSPRRSARTSVAGGAAPETIVSLGTPRSPSTATAEYAATPDTAYSRMTFPADGGSPGNGSGRHPPQRSSPASSMGDPGTSDTSRGSLHTPTS